MGLFNKDPETIGVVPEPVGAVPVPAGATDRVVVSATDGPLPETRAAFEAIRSGGGSSVDVTVSNVGLVDDEELLELVELEIRDIAAECGLTVGTIQRL